MKSFLARGIASALLAGEWNELTMTSRLVDALMIHTQPRWIGTLVRYALKEYPSAPRDARDELADALVASRVWPDVLAANVRVRRIVADRPEMRATRFDVPPIPTPGDLAAFLNLDVRQMDAFADRRKLARFAPLERMRHYRYREVAKPSGGFRLLEIPKPRLRAVQRMILDRIVAKIPVHRSALGFVRGRSVIDFASMHVKRDVVIRIDLRSFFETISARRVTAIWRAVGYPEAVARTLTDLTTHTRDRAIPHLPQGAPTSPALANLVAYGLDVRMTALAHELGATYARYADDIALSGDASVARAADAVLVEMMTIAYDEGFLVNEQKTRIQKKSVRQSLAGIVVNESSAWPREERERFEAILTNCIRRGPAAENREGIDDFRAHLRGRLAWLGQVNARHAERMKKLFDAIAW